MSVSPDRQQILTVSLIPSGKEFVANVRLWKIGQQDSVKSLRLAKSALEVQKSAISLNESPKPKRTISAINWSADGLYVAVAVRDTLITESNRTQKQAADPVTTAMIVDASDWQVKETISSSGPAISDIAFNTEPSEGTERIATFDGLSAHLWNRKDGSHLLACQPQKRINAVALSNDPGHKLLATGTQSLVVFSADLNDNGKTFGQSLAKNTEAHPGGVTALAFSPGSDDIRLVSGGKNGVIRLWQWDPVSRSLSLEPEEFNAQGEIVDLDWSADGLSVLATTSQAFSMINTVDKSVAQLKLPAEATAEWQCGTIGEIALDENPPTKVLAIAGKLGGGSAGYVLRVNEQGEVVLHARISGHGFGGITAIQFISGTPYVATTGTDGAAVLWNWQPRRESGAATAYEAFRFVSSEKGVFDAHRAPINGLAIDRNGSLATCSDDGTAVYWKNPLAQ